MSINKINWKTEKRQLKSLVPNKRSPRKISKEQEKLLTQSLEKFNLVEIPVINIDGTIIVGHQIIKVLSLLRDNNEVIDVRVPDRKLTKEEIDEYMIGSNAIHGEWDIDLLKEVDLQKQFLEQFEKMPNISLICEKLGLSKNTVYRWIEEDQDFKLRMDEASSIGVMSINDLAESKLISRINQNDMPAIKYWLEHNNVKYAKPNSPLLKNNLNEIKPIRIIEIYNAEDHPDIIAKRKKEEDEAKEIANKTNS